MLTARQAAIFDYIVEFRRANGCSPSIPELQRAFGIRSPNGVAGHLLALESKGLIRRARRGSRQIDVTGPLASLKREAFDIPVYKTPPPPGAGSGGTSAPSGCLTLDEGCLGFRPDAGCYALPVSGGSMSGAGIFDGDLAVVEPSARPRAGQLVVAEVDGRAALRRLVRVAGRPLLRAEPASGREPPMPWRSPVQGVVRTVIRRLK